MKFNIQTRGISIDMTPAFLSRLSTPAGKTSHECAVPLVQDSRCAATYVRQQLGVKTLATMLRFGPCAIGAFLLRCEPELVVVMFDPCEPEVRSWLEEGARRRVLRIGLRDASGTGVVDVSHSEVVDTMLTAARTGNLCSSDDLVRALGVFVDALTDDDCRKQLDIADMRIDVATLALVTPRVSRSAVTPDTAH